MENNKGGDLNFILHKLKGSGLKLPPRMYPSAGSLVSAVAKLKSVSEKQNFENTASLVCRALDSVILNCLNNGYKHAMACGDQNLARLCHNQLMDFNNRRNRAKTTVPDNRSSVNLPASGSVKKFHYAESLLNSSDFKPVKNNFVFNDGLAAVNNTAKPKQWTFATKLLNETYVNSDLNSNKSKLVTNPLEMVDKTITNDKQSFVRQDSCNQTNLKRIKSDLSLNSFRPVNDAYPSGIYRNSNTRAQIDVATNLSRSHFPSLNSQFADKNNASINPSRNNDLRSSKTDTSKLIVDKNSRKDESGLSVPKNRNPSRVATHMKEKRTPARRNDSASIQKKSSERLSTLKLKISSKANDSSGGLTKEKQSVNSKRKSGGTPGILKQNTQKDLIRNDKKKINFDNASTPVKRYSRLSKLIDSAKVTRCKRKHDSACSSDLNSTLRPRAKRIRKVTSTPCESNDKILSKKSRPSKGMVDSKNSRVNSSNYSAATTDMSSAYNETPKSTMTNRIGKVKVFYKRNLFSTPRDGAKKKWLK